MNAETPRSQQRRQGIMPGQIVNDRVAATISQFCHEYHVAVWGATALSSVSTDDFLLPESVLKTLPFAISLALRLSPSVLSTLTDHPNLLYEHHYRQLNFALDRLALALTEYIQSLNHRALPIPASQIVDWQNQRAHLSHKRIAIAAGLGWLGRNNLLVTPEFGSQIRLVTVLTDLPVCQAPASKIQPFSCGSCRACVAVCPAKAISDRPEDFNHQACFTLLKEFQRKRYVSQYICGLCVRSCPGKSKQTYPPAETNT